MNPHVVYDTRVILSSIQRDSAPTHQKCLVVYEFSCCCEPQYVGCTTQRLEGQIKQHVPMSIRKKIHIEREQPPHGCKTCNAQDKCDSATWQHLLENPECTKMYTDDKFWIIGQARSSFHLGVLESVYIKTQNIVLCRGKVFIFSLGLFNQEKGDSTPTGHKGS